ncbi:MAG: hypothetical protein AAB803_01165 [Patescibacteria group bacterium]
MPKKTKREKIIADYRKKLQRVQQLQESSPTSANPSPGIQAPVNTYRFITRTQTSLPASKAAAESELIYIKHDLTKTLLLASLAIGGELALFWFWK